MTFVVQLLNDGIIRKLVFDEECTGCFAAVRIGQIEKRLVKVGGGCVDGALEADHNDLRNVCYLKEEVGSNMILAIEQHISQFIRHMFQRIPSRYHVLRTEGTPKEVHTETHLRVFD